MLSNNGDSRGQAGTSSAITLVVTVVVAMVIASVLVPVAINELEGDSVDTLTQDTTVATEVNAELNSTLDSVTSGTPDTATVTLNDTRTSGTTQKTINNGSTADYSLDGGTVTVGVEDVDAGGSTATLNYTYTKDYAYSSGASALWGILGLTIVLGVFLYAIKMATDQF